MKRIFVTGISTEVGKTIASAIITEALEADYWKPIQAGKPTDTEFIRELVGSEITIHPEGIVLNHPMSPHASAQLEKREIVIDDLIWCRICTSICLNTGNENKFLEITSHNFKGD